MKGKPWSGILYIAWRYLHDEYLYKSENYIDSLHGMNAGFYCFQEIEVIEERVDMVGYHKILFSLKPC